MDKFANALVWTAGAEAAFRCGRETFYPFSGRKRDQISVEGEHFQRFQIYPISVHGANLRSGSILSFSERPRKRKYKSDAKTGPDRRLARGLGISCMKT